LGDFLTAPDPHLVAGGLNSADVESISGVDADAGGDGDALFSFPSSPVIFPSSSDFEQVLKKIFFDIYITLIGTHNNNATQVTINSIAMYVQSQVLKTLHPSEIRTHDTATV
jgi:hypothetical protein